MANSLRGCSRNCECGMKVLVTGATGFIGGNLSRLLVKRGWQVRVLVRDSSSPKALEDLQVEPVKGDLLDEASLEKALEGCDGLFHAAALYTFWSRDPRLIYATNVQGTANIMNAARRCGIKKIVYTSSESTLEALPAGSSAAKSPGLRPLHEIAGDYKRSKHMAESLVLEMIAGGLPAVIVNPTTPIGAWDVKPTPTGQFVVDFVNGKIFGCVKTGLNIVDVEDVAAGHLLAMEKGQPGSRYVLGNKNLTLGDIMKILEGICGVKAPRLGIPGWLALGAGYVDEFVEGSLLKRSPRIPLAAVKAARKTRYFDCSQTVEELGMPQTPVEESFRKAIDWFQQHGYVKQQALL